MVTKGNAMTVLIDGKEAFGSAADDIVGGDDVVNDAGN